MRKNIIRTPQRFITADLQEGEQAVIYCLNPKQRFINLKFQYDEKFNYYKPIISADNAVEVELNEKYKEQLIELQAKIIMLENLHTTYNYLFTIINSEFYLISVSLHNMSLGYDITMEIATQLGVKTLTPTWQGIYTNLIVNAFTEDIFIQRK